MKISIKSLRTLIREVIEKQMVEQYDPSVEPIWDRYRMAVDAEDQEQFVRDYKAKYPGAEDTFEQIFQDIFDELMGYYEDPEKYPGGPEKFEKDFQTQMDKDIGKFMELLNQTSQKFKEEQQFEKAMGTMSNIAGKNSKNDYDKAVSDASNDILNKYSSEILPLWKDKTKKGMDYSEKGYTLANFRYGIENIIKADEDISLYSLPYKRSFFINDVIRSVDDKLRARSKGARLPESRLMRRIGR